MGKLLSLLLGFGGSDGVVQLARNTPRALLQRRRVAPAAAGGGGCAGCRAGCVSLCTLSNGVFSFFPLVVVVVVQASRRAVVQAVLLAQVKALGHQHVSGWVHALCVQPLGVVL